ncbi:hypothetical protein Q3O98_09860 [Ralstonia pseudosolanacearum]|uniref:hypothetical protein n=1 Tax=Ralstonia pseudosolanacearum TaxID=1310165 RepID=UPI002674CCBA|nr:hypothetical protein [Ralstonia pseudosolanacearum]MDO3621402.1 hypothetical protein [Ralstonia pseudosolanacearum]
MSTIDLNNPPPNHNYKVSVEREETAGERWVRLNASSYFAMKNTPKVEQMSNFWGAVQCWPFLP